MDHSRITDDATTELQVGDRVQIADLGREDDYGTVIKGPHQTFTNDPTVRVSVEVPLVGTTTAHVPVSDVRRIPPDEEQEIGLRSWVVTGESICDDPEEYNHPHMLFVHEGSLPEIIRTYLAANGLKPPGTSARPVISDESVTAAAQVLAKLAEGIARPWDAMSEVQRSNMLISARHALAAALPYLSADRDTETAAEFAGFYITHDGSQPTLCYYPHEDEDGEHVHFADVGTSLDQLVKAAREHAASLRGEQ